MKKVLALLLALVLAAALVACSTETSSASPSASSAAPTSSAPASDAASPSAPAAGGKIGVAMPTKSLERWNRDGAFLKKQFEAQGYTVELTYSDNDATKQVNDIENMIADKVDLLVIAAIDSQGLSTVLKDAVDAKIPAIAYDRLIMDTSAVAYYVSFDNYTVGKLQGQYVVDTLKLDVNDKSKTYNIEFTAGDPADNNARFFYQGAYDVLKPFLDAGILKVPSGQIAFDQVATPKWTTATAMNRFQNILASFYSSGTQLDVALCSNDSTSLGVTQAIQSDYKGKNTVVITGQDGDEANLANIIDGKQSMTVYKAVANEAVVTVDLGIAMLKGEKPDGALIDKSGWKFSCTFDTKTYDNNTGIIPSYLLVPTVVTIDNLQKELVDTGYYKMDGKYPKAVG
ncbi:putative multiple sugar transport system substrate-binding protein [Sporobacter termitidis DSM 10068]|uniref:Putative multiple sugar transport system substrate-binding protein n=1 Tax=Sporobacter termitidis DSM 10068 TaxID=1123282 RepID=A0A1M5ZFT1_9FIRM|nr:sugar-binding protein [Sporobacter termitidis]SHI22991.1 putative multiple sugar transport system substrate-binding protein [Sporobacter termitidis DSM 10068]